MELKVINSGSSGNGYALIEDDEILLIECGVPVKSMLKSIDYQTGKVVGCLVTHSHGDHSKFVRDYIRYGIDIYASDEVSEEIEQVYGEKIADIPRMRKKQIGGFKVILFYVPHGDTECDGFLIFHEKIGSLLFITDAEYCPYDFSKHGITHVMIECNYSEDYISRLDDSGKFEHVLRGHMELQTCKRLIQSIRNPSLISVGLMHLSNANGDACRFAREIKELVDCDVNVYVAERGFQTELMLEPF